MSQINYFEIILLLMLLLSLFWVFFLWLYDNYCSSCGQEIFPYNSCRLLLSFCGWWEGLYKVSQKKGIRKCHNVCSTVQLMLSLEFSFQIQLKIEIHMFEPSTEPFLSGVREPRNKCFKYPIWHQLLESSKSSSIITIIYRLTSV